MTTPKEVLTNMSDKLSVMCQKFEDLQIDMNSLKKMKEKTKKASKGHGRRPDHSWSRSRGHRRPHHLWSKSSSLQKNSLLPMELSRVEHINIVPTLVGRFSP